MLDKIYSYASVSGVCWRSYASNLWMLAVVLVDQRWYKAAAPWSLDLIVQLASTYG
jgi:hypothetical protein